MSRREHSCRVLATTQCSLPQPECPALSSIPEVANFSCKGPNSKSFRLCGPHMVSITFFFFLTIF